MSLIDLKRSRVRVAAELRAWVGCPRIGLTSSQAGRSFNRGVVLLAELVAINHEIRERQEASNGTDF